MYRYKTHRRLSELHNYEIVYIPENAEELEDIRTKGDIMSLCFGNETKAQILLDRLEWQFPETILCEENNFD